MLFRKDIDKSCAYCIHSTKLDEESVLCIKKGVVSICKKCRNFAYDPCKRVPSKAKALDFSQFDKSDFSL